MLLFVIECVQCEHKETIHGQFMPNYEIVSLVHTSHKIFK